MTAKPLFDTMRAIIAEIVNVETSPHYADRATFKKVLSCIETEHNHLYNKRNELLHGTWLVGYTSFDDPNAKEFRIRKYKTTADGLADVQLPKTFQNYWIWWLVVTMPECGWDTSSFVSKTQYRSMNSSAKLPASLGSFSSLPAMAGPRCQENSK
jgi:hypothetical protein